MKELLNYAKASPGAVQAMRGLESHVRGSGLDPVLLELVRMRVSAINGCAYCLDMHSKDARAAGESEQRLHVLPAWREAPFYTPSERAALAWTEAVTRLADAPVSEELYDELRHHFSEKEAADLTVAVIAINGWNRLAATFRSPTPGSYQPRK
jgi:AhpD family alkylhydroperoxidase